MLVEGLRHTLPGPLGEQDIGAKHRLFGDRYRWSILGTGRNQLPLATIGAAMGANVRVGLEDSLWIGPGRLAVSSAEQVLRIRAVLEALNIDVATPDEARDMLDLKGAANVDF